MGDSAKRLLDLQTFKATHTTIILISDRLYAISGGFRCREPFDMAVRQSPISITGNIGRALQGHMQTLASVHQLGSLSCVPIPHRRLSFVTCAFLHALCSERAFANVRMCAAHGRGPFVRVRSLSCCRCTSMNSWYLGVHRASAAWHSMHEPPRTAHESLPSGTPPHTWKIRMYPGVHDPKKGGS